MGLRKKIRRTIEYIQINRDLNRIAESSSGPLKPAATREHGNFVATLTSHPPRFKTLPLSLQSIIEQDLPPKKIVLNLYEGDLHLESVPEIIQSWQSEYFAISIHRENLRSHLKYYHTLERFPNDNILIVDDDIVYGPSLFKELWNEHKQNPNAIICGSNRVISIENGNINPYQQWKYARRGSSNDRIIMCTSGVLLPPNSLNKEVSNSETFMKLSLTTDDLWLTLMARLENTPIVGLGYSPRDYKEIYIRKDRPLWAYNKQGADDKNWNMLLSHYKIDVSSFMTAPFQESLPTHAS